MFGFLKLAKRLTEAERQLEDCQRQLKHLQLDWDDTYDKLRTIVQRIAKRAERAEKLESEGEMAEKEGFSATGLQLENGVANGLTPRARSIQAKILARRGLYQKARPS